MNLGISILDDRVLLALHHGSDSAPEFLGFPLASRPNAEGAGPGCLWDIAGQGAADIYAASEKLILTIPASSCMLKRLEIKGEIAERNPDYLQWLASVHLPGRLQQYRYDFIPATRSFDETLIEMIFYAAPRALLEQLLHAVRKEGDPRQLAAIPEQLGLVKALARSLAREDIPQAGAVNWDRNGATTVYVKDGRYNHSRYFIMREHHGDDISADIETYLLSRADVTESLPLVITGFPGDFKTNWTPIVPAFMGIHNLEFAGAWGVADWVTSGVS